MKLKESHIRQIIKEEYAFNTIVSAMNKIAILLPIECRVIKYNHLVHIAIDPEYSTQVILEYKSGDNNAILYGGKYGADNVSDDWLIEQSYCKSYDEMSSSLKWAIENFLEDGIAVLKDDADIDVVLD